MIKLAFCMRRLPGISRDEFQDYWLNKHADLVMGFQPAIGFKRYVQFHGGYDKLTSKAAEFRNSPEPFDGIAELWWEDEESMVQTSNTKEARAGFAALYEDEKHFIDMENSPMWYGTEHVIHDSEE
jgi:hypothetical protein